TSPIFLVFTDLCFVFIIHSTFYYTLYRQLFIIMNCLLFRTITFINNDASLFVLCNMFTIINGIRFVVKGFCWLFCILSLYCPSVMAVRCNHLLFIHLLWSAFVIRVVCCCIVLF